MTSFHECSNCKKDGISIPLQLEDNGQYCCSMCDSSYHLDKEEIVIGKKISENRRKELQERLDLAIKNDKSHVSKISQNTSSLLGVASIVLLFSLGLVFPAMADSFPIKIVEDSIAPTEKVYVSVDFDHDGICDTESVLISILTAEKIGINSQCFLPNI